VGASGVIGYLGRRHLAKIISKLNNSEHLIMDFRKVTPDTINYYKDNDYSRMFHMSPLK
jgi:ribosomal protein S6